MNFSKNAAKIISLILSLILLMSAVMISASAVSINSGSAALEAQFSRDAGPNVDGYNIDYSYFSPVRSASDTTKYPLMIFMAGWTEGEYPGKELTSNCLSTWSSSELQARFSESKGAYILFARAPEEKGLCWDSPLLTKPLKAAIDDFTAKHPNVDKSRIYVTGWCLGATGALRLVSTYSNYFAGLLFMSAVTTISAEQAAKLSDTAVWIFHCKKDTFAPIGLYADPSWSNMKKAANDPSKIRFTTFETAPDCGTLLPNHNTWNMIAYDMANTDSRYSGMKTVDGTGSIVPASEGLISWLSSQKNESNPDCSCECHNSGLFAKFFWSIKVIIYKLFSINDKKICACSVSHW